MGGRLASLELVRGLASLSIVVVHAITQIQLHPVSQIQSFHDGFLFPGNPGIEVFFVLSGFTLFVAHGSDDGKGWSVARFVWNRAVRVYPLYWLFMFELLRRLAFADWQHFNAPSFGASDYASWFSLVPAWQMDLLPVAWTLRFEVAFYLLFALCMLPRYGRIFRVVWVAATVITAFAHSGRVAEPFSHVVDPYTFEFLAGVGAGWAYLKVRLTPSWGFLIGAVGLLTVLSRLSYDRWGLDPGPASARVTYGLGYGTLLLGLAVLERAGTLRLGRWAGWMGACSYPLYLSHPATLDYGIRSMAGQGFPARYGVDAEFCALVVLSCCVALAVTILIDRPILRALRWRRAGTA